MNDKNEMLVSLAHQIKQFKKKLAISLTDNLYGDITFAQLMLLNQIDRGVVTVSELSKNLIISPPAASKLVDQLFKLNLVTRVRSENDRRIVKIQLTEKGIEILEKNKQIKEKIFQEVLSPLTQEEIQQFINLLKKINKDD
ncbi:hypothetical protein BHF71_02345 [Vulcanibacillus modesticaldus]|uniref:HTH marR-type domain-containing protein n=1 Tax=Vulcanibacillus modesticaldus TaxID=337097 RepID=A0A1D2YTS4_9BACI|nr:MarR family transcriptional regulator [Vulcanibacillus modesticaldus]OEF99045.1 hypothetical protein BHF71_02345 [Vulcanibacillus modesticaldus]